MSNLCIIQARGGSKSIPKKNSKNFLGKPIIAYSIVVALNSGLFQEVMVSTDDKEIAAVAKSYRAKVPFKRSKENAGDFANTLDVVTEVQRDYYESGMYFDNICILYSTAPFYLQAKRDLFKVLKESTSLEMNLLVPFRLMISIDFHQLIASNSNFKFSYLNQTPVKGLRFWWHRLCNRDWGMPRPNDVLISGIMTGIYLGYETIAIVGADYSILEFTKRMSMTMGIKSSIDIVDSVPCPIVKNSREQSFRICKESFETSPRKGFSAVDQRYYIGYKLHLLTNEYGVFQDMQITPANVHDINFLKQLDPETYTRVKTILGDRGDISANVRTDLFTDYNIQLSVPYRSNHKDKVQPDRSQGILRRRIKVQFAQLCNQFRLKINLAKSFAGSGSLTRVTTKLAAISVLQAVNLSNNRSLNHFKHAWA